MNVKHSYVDSSEAFNILRGKITDAMLGFDDRTLSRVNVKDFQSCIFTINSFSPDKLILFEGDFPEMMFDRLYDAFYDIDCPEPKFSFYPMCHAQNYILSATRGFEGQDMESDLPDILKELSDLDWLYKY